MINIPIDESASILEAFYESGDSYKGHNKYNVLTRYKVVPEGSCDIDWDGLRTKVDAKAATVMETTGLHVDVSGYNRFRIFGLIPTWVRTKVYCNGELVLDGRGTVMDGGSAGMTGYLDGDVRITHNTVNSLKLEFINESTNETSISVHYLGMLSDVPRKESPFNDEWEGFFAEEPDYGIYENYLFSEEELELLREKIKLEPYKSCYEKAREAAYAAMNDYPEKLIARTVYKHHRCKATIKATEELAIVGQIEQNKEMMKMACRSALSIATCDHLTSDVMETVPMLVWKQRSFTESYMAQKICTVLWLCGGLLSWHGRNYLYDALIMKVLPRMEADFMTMEYIYECNQGISFMHGYMKSLITLSRQYPRYKKKIEDAYKIIDEVFGNLFEEDGSFEEGGMYLDYTLRHFMPTIHFISKYEKKSVNELFGRKLANLSNYGLSIVSEDARWIPFGDCGSGRYQMVIPAMMYLATGDMRWASLMKYSGAMTLVETVVSALADIPESDEKIVSEFAYFPKIGLARVCRDGVLLAVTSGPSNDTHAHGDKGGFVIHKNGDYVVPEVYAPYNYAEAVDMHKTSKHSLAVPVLDGKAIDQYRGKQYTSVVEKAVCTDGVFEFICDNSGMWKAPEVLLNKRTIYSEKANEFIITDEFEFSEEGRVEFRLNIKKGADVTVIPVNWTPCEEKCTEIFNFRDKIIEQKSLLSEKLKDCKLITKVIV